MEVLFCVWRDVTDETVLWSAISVEEFDFSMPLTANRLGQREAVTVAHQPRVGSAQSQGGAGDESVRVFNDECVLRACTAAQRNHQQ